MSSLKRQINRNNAESYNLPVAVTMGCPAGVGPEIAIRAIAYSCKDIPAIVVGDINILRHVARRCNLNVEIEPWKKNIQVFAEDNVIYCLNITNLAPDRIEPGVPTKITGAASYDYIIKAVELCEKGLVCGIATAPISKTGLKLSGINFPGHTEILAELTNTSDFLMMMAGPKLKVTLTTIHVPLKDVPDLLTRDSILKTIEITWQSLRKDFGIKSPRIAVCGLNPHAGEGGMFGTEEEEIIAPACKDAKVKGLDIFGPLPPDTVFYFAAKGHYHAVVCQYHDQGLIPFKLLHFSDGVNVTLGLPIVRTSVDHGTAYDIAWTGKADPSSMVAAINLARTIYENRNKHLLDV